MDQEKKIRFQINLTTVDLWKLALYHSNRGYLGFFNVLFTVAAIYLLFARWAECDWLYRILLIVCVLMFTVWQPLLLLLKAARQATNKLATSETVLEFEEDKITVYQNGQTMDVTWEQIAKIERGFGMYVVYMDRIHAYLIPDRNLDGQKEALCRIVRAHLPAARRKRI